MKLIAYQKSNKKIRNVNALYLYTCRERIRCNTDPDDSLNYRQWGFIDIPLREVILANKYSLKHLILVIMSKL